MKYLIKIDRIAAWILFFGMTLYFISGYGMTKGILDAGFAAKIHLDFLSIIIIIAFVAHAGFATRLAFIRWKMWNLPIKVVWGMFFVYFFLGFIYLDQFYGKNSAENTSKSTTTSVPASTSTTIIPGTTTTTTFEKTFNAKELAKYNGKNGSPPYVAVDGLVYDMTGIFTNGSHFSHTAGKELTSAFYSEHAKRQIIKYPVVGKFIS